MFEAVFKQFGMPKAIRTDNGVPFASDRDRNVPQACHATPSVEHEVLYYNCQRESVARKSQCKSIVR